MNVIYTSKAKDDLARIDWRIRERIISRLADFGEISVGRRALKQIHGSDLVKTNYAKYVIVGETKGRDLNVLSIIREQRIKSSGVKLIEA